jgi:hypothetical protein
MAGENDEILGVSPAIAEQIGSQWPDRRGRVYEIASVF